MKIRIKDYENDEFLGYWNGSFYSSKKDDIPNLSRIYIDKKMIHITYKIMCDMRKNIDKYSRAYTYGYCEEITDFFNKLLNWETKDISTWDEINITSWNHLKKQYIAIIEKPDITYGLIRVFISEILDKTSSGANGNLSTQEPTKIRTLVEIKNGSHKNMVQNIYRKTNKGWMHLAYRINKEEWKMVKGEIPENIVTYQEPIKKKVNPLEKYTKKELVKELCSRGYDVKINEDIKFAIPENGKNRFAVLEMK